MTWAPGRIVQPKTAEQVTNVSCHPTEQTRPDNYVQCIDNLHVLFRQMPEASNNASFCIVAFIWFNTKIRKLVGFGLH